MIETKQTRTGSTVYNVDRPEPLVCPKCHKKVDFVLGEDELMACEQCYQPPKNPKIHTMPGEVIGEQDQIGELRGTRQESAKSLLRRLGVKK